MAQQTLGRYRDMFYRRKEHPHSKGFTNFWQKKLEFRRSDWEQIISLDFLLIFDLTFFQASKKAISK